MTSDFAAGNYRFVVKACNSDGIWNETGATFAFAVQPFLWQTWWFRASLAARGADRFPHSLGGEPGFRRANDADAHRDDGQRFIVRADQKITADEKLAAFVELESAIRTGST